MVFEAFLEEKGMDAALAGRFRRFAELILEWNEKINVTAIRDMDGFMRLNVMDSLTMLGREEFENAGRILDLGTGGGLPGVPLAMARPDKTFMLDDSVGKKLKVVEAVCGELGIENVSFVHARAEDLAFDRNHREAYDLVVARAVANMSTLSEYCLPFVKIGGSFTAYKTESAADEIAEASGAIRKLGGEPFAFEPDGIEGSGHGFVRIRKIRETPKQYPRKAGLPSKSPLR